MFILIYTFILPFFFNIYRDVLEIPHTDFKIDIIFCGEFFKLEKIKESEDSRKEFIKLYEKILHVDCKELLYYIQFLSHSLPYNKIRINPKFITQENIDKMIHESICNATVYNNDSEESKADIMVQENVSGATVSENIYNDDGPIKYSFVQTECHINLEKEVEDRKTMLDSVFNQLYPKNDNFEDDFNPPDLDYNINKSNDGASNRQNEVNNSIFFSP